MHITFVQRRPFPEQYSLESYFDRVAVSLRSRGDTVDKYVVPEFSKGLIPRVKNTRSMRSVGSSDIIQITGDIHYVALGSPPEKTVLTVLDCGTLERLKGFKHQIFKKFWYTMPAMRVAAVHVISHETKRALLEYVPKLDSSRVHVIPVSVSELFRFVPQEFRVDKPRILQIGTRPNKNVLRTIAALRDIPCTLAVVGSLNAEHKAALEENRIQFENFVGLTDAQIVEQYQKSDIVSFASTLEGFGMPIVEAQVTGRPVVTSNISSMPEVAGDGAVLVDPYSVDSIRSGFLEIISNPSRRDELIALGCRNAERFSQDKITEQFVDLYEALVKHGV